MRRFGLVATVVLVVAMSLVAVAVYTITVTPTTTPAPHRMDFAAEMPPPCRPSAPTTACAFDQIPILCGWTEMKCLPMRTPR